MPDMFGVNRRQVESLQAQAEASRYQLRCDLSDADRERGERRHSGGRIARADRGHASR